MLEPHTTLLLIVIGSAGSGLWMVLIIQIIKTIRDLNSKDQNRVTWKTAASIIIALTVFMFNLMAGVYYLNPTNTSIGIVGLVLTGIRELTRKWKRDYGQGICW